MFKIVAFSYSIFRFITFIPPFPFYAIFLQLSIFAVSVTRFPQTCSAVSVTHDLISDHNISILFMSVMLLIFSSATSSN